jgi:putative SOS response-associated peptidase YedK
MDLTMCNRYNIKGSPAEIAEHLRATLVPNDFELPSEDIIPGGLAPGLLLNRDGERELVPMQFGLAKAGAKEPFDRRWPNNNARIEKHDQWPWKVPFRESRCIVPLTEFREPCYWGETAGTEVYFKAPDLDYLGVAGLYNVWKGPGGHQLVTMTLLLRPASEYVMEHGHHRQPFFIDEAGFDEWTVPGERDPDNSLAVLRQYAFDGPFEYRFERHMAASWKGRQKARLAERDKQQAAIEETGPLGI